jgi:HD-like signal output (HDOD) protein
MDGSMKRVIFVDPDQAMLDDLKENFAPKHPDWQCFFTPLGGRVLEAVDQGANFDVVVTGLTLTDMDSIACLNAVKERRPQTVRIVLNDGKNPAAMFKASTVAHQFLDRPFDHRGLGIIIQRTFLLRSHLANNDLRERLHATGAMPTLPVLYQKIVQEMHSPDPSIAKIAEIIEQDIGMSAKLLQVVNSAGMGVTNKVSNIRQAASLLGLNKLRTMVLVTEMFSLVEPHKLPRGFNVEDLWHHSMKVGGFARRIAEAEGVEDFIIDDSFMAGLLHDLGLVILAMAMPDVLNEVLEVARSRKVMLFAAEREVLGATHAEVGGYLLELWGLPDQIVIGVTFHDFPTGVPEENYPSALPEHGFTPLTAVHVANYFCEDESMLEYGYSQVDLDTTHLEMLNFLDKIDGWWDACHDEGPQ